mgnify:CR=1 FL=1
MITRSVGIKPVINGQPIMTPIWPGGGIYGKTKELDNAVEKIAQKLSETFDKEIEIRFNSHRESGGAFFKLKENSFSVGIGARIIYVSGRQIIIAGRCGGWRRGWGRRPDGSRVRTEVDSGAGVGYWSADGGGDSG